MNFSNKTPVVTIVPPCHKRIHCLKYQNLELLSIATESHIYQYKNYEL